MLVTRVLSCVRVDHCMCITSKLGVQAPEGATACGGEARAAAQTRSRERAHAVDAAAADAAPAAAAVALPAATAPEGATEAPAGAQRSLASMHAVQWSRLGQMIHLSLNP